MSNVPVVAIDGPTASGKGTIAQRVADALQFNYLDSGALYRLVALRAVEEGLGPDEADRLSAAAAAIAPKFAGGRVTLNGKDVTDAIRGEDVSQLASRIAVLSGVRRALLDLQRSQRRPPGLVADGRDMGTVVFPEANPKIYLTASVAARADRRYKQLMEKGFSANIPSLSQEQVRLDIEARDLRDAQREASPLKPAEDAHRIDSSELSVDEVVALVLSRYAQSQISAGQK
ncbi:MAG TPA: (d)CMP kinase [Burkholderiaceae bacterium]|nr:(d)CMP kinase [Burkholderiaceae bacterium]